MATVLKIPAKFHPITHLPETKVQKRRVAAYARVSTDSEEQQTSYAAQVDRYTKYIQERADWEFVAVYTDEGISALNTKHRDGFNRMVADALDGKIDLIVTKSVSRFARNTVDSLTTVRKLKEKGVEVFFEKENIYTLDSKGELLITIMSSLAQEESRSISENVTWGQRKRMADGKVSLPYKHFLGYRKGVDGLPEIVPEEAEIVRNIYRWFMEGKTPTGIARTLTEQGIPTPAGKEQWCSSTVKSILTNEKYKGSALLQKRFTVDFLTKKSKVNEGEVPQYYIEESHPAIIVPEEFELVQAELLRRQNLRRQYNGKSVFAARLVCGDCGNFFGAKVWHSNSKYRQVIWQCNHKFQGVCKCRTPHLQESVIQQRFQAAVQELLQKRKAILENCQVMLELLTDCTDLERQLQELETQKMRISEQVQGYVRENSEIVQDQEKYEERYQALVGQYEPLQKQETALQEQRAERLARREQIQGFQRALNGQDGMLPEFDTQLWLAAVEKAVVHRDGKIVFVLKDGTELVQKI